MSAAAAPKVSVILPTRNRASTLKRSIDSVLAQTFRDLELIVVDDGSSDGTAELMKSYADPRILFHSNPGPHSAACARNAGIRLARAEMIAFQDSDDEWLPRKLEIQVKRMESLPPEVGMVYCSSLQIRLDGTKRGLNPDVFTAADGDIGRRFHEASVGIGTQTVLVRKAVLDRVGLFDEKLRAREDFELFIRVARSYRFDFVDERLVRRFETAGNLSSQAEAGYEAHRYILEKHRDEIERDPVTLAAYHRTLGTLLLATARSIEARAWLWKAASGGRARPSDFIWLFVSFGGRRLYEMLRRLKSLSCRLCSATSSSMSGPECI
jgi:glycosyltransferase involved in cell wall biosynthesis